MLKRPLAKIMAASVMNDIFQLEEWALFNFLFEN